MTVISLAVADSNARYMYCWQVWQFDQYLLGILWVFELLRDQPGVTPAMSTVLSDLARLKYIITSLPFSKYDVANNWI